MRKVSWILSLTALCLLSACYFNDSDWYKADPVAGDPPEVSVITNLDTLYNPRVNDSLQVIYEVSVVNGKFYFMEAMVSDGIVHSSDSAYGSFWVNHSQSNDTGLDTLYLDFYHSSNTNTLADVTGYEALITSQKYAIDFSEEDLP
jgi:hypothetical protein